VKAVDSHTVTYPISPDFWKRWSTTDALREIIANALDEDKKPRVEWRDGILTVEDKGPGIGEEGLILGVSNKGQGAIGQFGEGLKAGCAVLTAKRGIGRVLVETVGYTLEPKLVKSELLKIASNGTASKHRLLSYTVTANSRTRGTKVTVECPEDEAQKAIALFLHLVDPAYTAPPEPGRIVFDAPGKIFIGGLYVQSTNGLTYGYDFPLSQKGMQNRDRSTIDGYYLERQVHQILSSITDPDILQKIVEAALAGELKKAERAFAPHGLTPGYRKAMKAVGKRLFGDEKVCYKAQGAHRYSGHEEWDDWEEQFHSEDEMLLDLKDRGYRVIEPKLDYWEFEQLMKLLGVRSAGDLYRKPELRKRHKEQKTLWLTVEQLTDAERENFERAVATVRAMWGSNAIAAVAPYKKTTEEGADDWGLYLPSNGKIGIHIGSLKTFKDALETLTHEAAHRLRHKFSRYGHRQDYGDRTRGFEDQLVEMAATAAKRLSEAGLLPTSLAELEAEEAARDQHPADLACALMREQMKAKGFKTYTSLAEAAGVTPTNLKTIIKGTDTRGALSIPKPQNAKAVAEALGVDWLPIFIATACCNAMSSHTRRHSDNRLYGHSYTYTTRATAELRERGGRYAELADLIDTHARGEVPTPKDDDSWHAPYREVIESEIARMAAEA
jgi:hypothetical protein